MYYVFPKYLKIRKYAQLVALLTLILCIAAFTIRTIRVNYTYPTLYPNFKFTFWSLGSFLWGGFEVLAIASIAISIKLFKSKFESIQKEKDLEKEKLQAELNFLKTQINPHFLFNTLNNIYGLSLKQSPHTSTSILKLSELLRFILHEGSQKCIKISNEIKVLEDYIELERLRYGKRLDFKFEKIIDDHDALITPLLLLPLVENSFKHGPSESRSLSFIHLKLQLNNGVLYFQSINSKETTILENQKGIGLKNIMRQLDLIYGIHQQIEIIDDSHTFEVNLTINLKAHESAQLHHH